MKKIAVVFLFLVGLMSRMQAQQDPQFTQFFYNKLVMNPAYAGSKDLLCFTGLFRSQWVGLEGAPSSFLFSGDAPIRLGRQNFGIGLTALGDFIGYEENYSFRLAGNWRSPQMIGPGYLRAGLDLGVTSKGIKNNNWIYPTGIPEPSIQSLNNNTNMVMEAGVGVYYYGSNFYAGVSALHLAGMRFADINIAQARHLFAMGGYTFEEPFHPDWDFNPNVLIKTDFATATFDVNVNAIWRKFVWGGLTYRLEDAIAINIGADLGIIRPSLRSLQIGYSYDLNTSRLSSYNSGSHEISIRYCIDLKPVKDIIPGYSVRFTDTRDPVKPVFK
ncbi:MAG: type IX secretion system membrane protein PorP/SprF [Bacteroidia bacterium]|jgi:type IX secretion system PorP/SprF family membrane protein